MITIEELTDLFNKYKSPDYLLTLFPLTKFIILVDLKSDVLLESGKTETVEVAKEFNVDICFMFKLPIEKEVQMFLSELEEKLRLAKYHKLMDEQSEKIGKLCGVTAEMICRERGIL